MNSAHDLMEQLRVEGASRYAGTALAADHSGVTRRVRRGRAVRTSALSVAGVVAAGAAVFGASQILGSVAEPIATPTAPSGPTSAPSVSDSPVEIATISVHKQERIEDIATDLAATFGGTQQEALDAITQSLPEEAKGNPEGWVAVGDYSLDATSTLREGAVQLVAPVLKALEAAGVPREKWNDTVILASIVQQEAPAGHSQQSAVARVLLNRLDAEMPLQLESPLAYFLRADERVISDDGWAVDTPYNTYMYNGLPPSAIGAPTQEALEAAADPADGDWMFFLRKKDGNVLFFTNYEEFAVAVDEEFPGTGASE